jgi:hypothetical protein
MSWVKRYVNGTESKHKFHRVGGKGGKRRRRREASSNKKGRKGLIKTEIYYRSETSTKFTNKEEKSNKGWVLVHVTSGYRK